MFETSNDFLGASFACKNNTCEASGDFRIDEGRITNINIAGSFKKNDQRYAFTANYDNKGAVNIYGVTEISIIEEVATEVKSIIEEIGNYANVD